MCDICQGDGYTMQDIGTATTPDWIEVPCKCNPIPTDTAWTFIGTEHEELFDYPDFPVAGIDFDRTFNDRLYGGL